MADVKGSSGDFALSGSLLVWYQARECAPTCSGLDLLGRDIATGQSYHIASETSPLSQPAVSGRRVAWQTDIARSLYLTDLSTMLVTRIVTGYIGLNEYLARPVMSDEYLAWFAIEQQGDRGAHLRLFSYALATGQTQVVVDKQLPELRLEPPLAISGHRVVWADPTPHTLDLATGEAMDLGPGPADSVAARGLTTVWSAKGGPNGRDTDIWGYRQGDAAPTLLASGPGNQRGVTLAGDWLVWENQGGPQDQRLSAAALDAAFAHPATPPPDAAAPAQAIGVTQFNHAWTGGHFVFWLEYHNPLSTLLGRDPDHRPPVDANHGA